MVKLDDVDRMRTGEFGASRRAVGAVKAAFTQLRDSLSPSGWTLTHELSERTPGHFIVRMAMHRDGIAVSACGFVIGDGPLVEFARPAHRRVTGPLDATGVAEFRRLIETWAAEVQAGVAHRWTYEARRPRGALSRRAPAPPLESGSGSSRG
jgi:hypothetical protein